MIFSFGSIVVDAIARLLTPFIIVFALYVLVHGHDSPGGGFQGGAILAAGFIVVRLVRGGDSWGPSRQASLRLACAGVLIYTVLGTVSFLFGQNFLDYSALPVGLPGGARRAIGSLIIEAGVLIAVTGVLTLIFDTLSAYGHDEGEKGERA